jgi:pilus assembly protein FimV
MARDTQSSPANEKKLEQYGVWVKVKPREVIPAPATEDSFELSDLESPRSSVTTASPAPDESALTAEEEKLLDELETELSPEEATSDVLVPEEEPLLDDEGELPDIEGMADEEAEDAGASELGEEELPELEEDLVPAPRSEAQKKPSVALDLGEVEVTLTENGIDKDQFDDLEALESELASVTTRASTTSSAEILARIEEELRSIRTDLTQLRGELSGLRKSADATAAETPATGAETQSGFFDEDEDETIALTGDELDNILNTADIMEEVAEAPRVDSAEEEQPAAQEAAPLEDILSYETPVLEEDKISPAEDLNASLEETLSEDSLVFSDADAKDTETTTLEELPSELVLEDLAPSSDSSQQAGEVNLDELPELDLEGIPEIESETPSPESAIAKGPAEKDADASDASDETIDLETLDLGEEPMVIEAVPAQPDDLEEIPEAEAVEEEKTSGAHSLADEVDLEALAAEANELEGNAPATPTEDLEIGELESIGEEKEIEIDFESEAEPVVESAIEELAPAEPESAEPESAEPESAEPESAELESAEQILDAEEVAEESPAPSAGGGTAVPENLKDEIRTVLKYMDNLLEALPDEKIQEFASSDYFVMYKKLFEDLGLGE